MGIVAVAGADGYIGMRLVPRLLKQGHRVRVLCAGAPEVLDAPWSAELERVDVPVDEPSDEPAAMTALCAGAEIVYDLRRSPGEIPAAPAPGDICADLMADAAAAAGVSLIVRLTGTRPSGDVAAGPQRAAVPILTLRAGPLIGAGSAAFELVRHLTDALPLVPAPGWVSDRVRPLAVGDALHYLLAAGQLKLDADAAYELSGPAEHSWAELIRIYAEVTGLRRPLMLRLPMVSTRLASLWAGLLTPIPRATARRLLDSLAVDAGGANRASERPRIDRLIPPPAGGLTECPTAVRLALANVAAETVRVTWASAEPVASPAHLLPSDPGWAGARAYREERVIHSSAPPEKVFSAVESIGGDTGYYALTAAWELRGAVDALLGGAGLRRGRRLRERPVPGDVVDWWRVEDIAPGRLLRLRAEMSMPGTAWLELAVQPEGSGSSLVQRVTFRPRGVSGRIYWRAVLPLHGFVFASMAERIVAEAERA